MNKNFISVLLILMLVHPCKAQYSKTPSISETELRRHVSFLASDSLQGRDLGTPGIEIAANYLRKEAIKAGLKPAGKDYFQNFKLISSRPDKKHTFIKIPGSNSNLTDSLVCTNQNTEHLKISGKFVFVGFGYHDKENDYDDLEGIDVEDKIVICSAGTPETFKKKQSFRWDNQLEREKTERFFQKGALAIVFVTNPKDSENRAFKQISTWMNRQQYSLKPDTIPNTGKIFITVPDFADNLLGKKGKWKNYLTKITRQKKSDKIVPHNLKIEIHSSKFINTVETNNVVGMIEGNDPELKNECVVYMAHYDHLGVNQVGEVYNGADDNATGSAALLEIACAFSNEDFKPKRSIMFLWVTGEEKGMLGSHYYIDHPLFPIDKTVTCINLDMIGRVYEPRDSVWKNSPKQVKGYNEVFALINDFNPKLKNVADSVASELGLTLDKSLPKYFFRSSDHYHFHNRGVPIINLATGYHADYHKITDEVSRIRFDKMKRVTELSFLVGYQMAGH